jgi:hypothetical protein
MFLNPLGLLALLGVPAVIALHLFRRRFERRKVSALFLWEARSSTTRSGRRREHLLRSPSFWSELALALLLGLACAGPRACGSLEARHLVVVLDGSASMAAAAAGDSGAQASAAARAVEAVRATIEALPSGSRVTVVESGNLPRILIGPAAFPREGLARLGEYAPASGRHDLGPAAALALEIAGAGAVTLYTDHFAPEAFPEQVGITALGTPRENLAITRAHRALTDDSTGGEEEVLLSLANFSRRRRGAEVELLLGDALLARERLELEAGAREQLTFRLPPDTPAVRARLAGDALPIDDEAWLAPPERRELRLATDLDAEARRFLGLERAGSDSLERWLALVPRSVGAALLEEAHLALCSGPAGGAGTWCLALETGPGERLDLIGPYLIEKRHPLLAGVTLDGVVWSAAARLRLPGTPLVSAGDLVLLSEERLGGRRLFHANLDWRRSSLQRTPDWPILLHNLAALRRDELSGARTTNLAAGEVFHFQAEEPADYDLSGPDGTRELKALSTLAIEGLERVGRYTLRSGGATLAEFAVHFGDDAESDLRSLSSGERVSAVELAEERSGSSWLVMLLGTLALAALLLDWWFLRPRAGLEFTTAVARRRA